MSPESKSEVHAENPWAIAIRMGANTDNKKDEIEQGKHCLEQARGSNGIGEGPHNHLTCKGGKGDKIG